MATSCVLGLDVTQVAYLVARVARLTPHNVVGARTRNQQGETCPC